MKQYALPKSSLLRTESEFEYVYSRGRRVYGDRFCLVFAANSYGYNRLGISVHRKIRGAVRRNRIKRIIRESFRLNRDIYPAGADIVFAVKPGFPLTSTRAVAEAVSLFVFSNE
ncbi:MAG: ribonuclease P protein component [Desulfobacterales bacterium]|nr:MAG: ribonuclease P protein component [Desulfobacterales bacterium]